MRIKMIVSLIALSLFGLADAPSASAQTTAFGPHAPPRKGPWFEGWYSRITDTRENRSVAVIVASQFGKNEIYRPHQGTPGYIAIIVQDNDSKKATSYESFPEITFNRVNGNDLSSNGHPSNTDFLWEVPGQGYFSPSGYQLKIDDQVEIAASFKNHKPWSSYWENWGPEGYGTFMSFLPLHWFVKSLDSFTEYSLSYKTKNGTIKEIQSTGSSHIEKNWGKAFPKAWMWMQGHNEEKEASLALAGGILSLGPISLKTYLAGYKSKNVDAEFQIGQALDMSYTDKIDSCKGEYQVRIKNGQYLMILKAKANPDSFAPVSIPTENGYLENGGKESFLATIDVEIHNNNWIRDFISKDSLIEKTTFKNAALEFGAGFMLCPAGK